MCREERKTAFPCEEKIVCTKTFSEPRSYQLKNNIRDPSAINGSRSAEQSFANIGVKKEGKGGRKRQALCGIGPRTCKPMAIGSAT